MHSIRRLASAALIAGTVAGGAITVSVQTMSATGSAGQSATSLRHRERRFESGVPVALRWFGNPGGHTLPPGVPGCCGEFDTVHFWIYKDGALVASSPGIIAVSQSAVIPPEMSLEG